MDQSIEERFARLEREVETLLGIVAGQNATITSLVATHPNYDQMQLHLASVTEMLDALPGNPMKPHQRQTARKVAEGFQQVQQAKGTIDPLRNLDRKT